MTNSQIETKIQELETWLIENPNSSERYLIASDLKKLRTVLLERSHE
ncbi:hypothetical protein [Flavobacterium sp.]